MYTINTSEFGSGRGICPPYVDYDSNAESDLYRNFTGRCFDKIRAVFVQLCFSRKTHLNDSQRIYATVLNCEFIMTTAIYAHKL